MAKYTANTFTVEMEEVTRDNPLPYTKDGADYQGSLGARSLSLKYEDTRLNIEEGDYIVKRDDGTFYPITRASKEANFTLKE